MKLIRNWHYLLAMLLAVATVRAEDAAVETDPAAKPTNALSVRQDHVKRMMQDLDQKFVELARSIEKSEPAQAKRLIEALQQSRELTIEGRMGKIATLLNQTQFDTASEEQKLVINDLKKLIHILLEDELDKDRIQAEIDRLEKWKAQLDQLIPEQTNEKRDSEKLADKDKTLNDLGQQIAALEAIIQKQQAVIDNTVTNRAQGVQALGKPAEQQAAVRKETQDLAKQIGKPRQDDDAAKDPAKDDSKPGEAGGKPGEAGGKPGEAGGKPGEAGGKPGEAGGKPGEAGGKPGEAGGKPDPSAGKEPGQQSIEKATDKQKAAEENLGQGKGKAAESDERAALDELGKALDELKKEQSRIASLPPEAFNELAKNQDGTADKTAKLGDDMKKAADDAAAAGESGGGPPGESGESGPAGQKSIQDAQDSMKQASGGLQKKDPKQAANKQKKAVKDLKNAREEIEKRLAQLRKEQQLEKLAALEARFREMLTRQQPLTIATGAVDRQRIAGKLRRTDRLALVKVSDEEKLVGEMAQKALDIIVEDGTSVVFAQVTGQLRDDLRGVSDLIRGERTDKYVQSQQKEIEKTLAELIEALQQAQKQADSDSDSDSDDSMMDDNEPLLPNSAELKLLKSAQMRVNRRTASFEQNRPQGELETVLKQEVRNIAKRQEEVMQMTEKLSERK